MYVGANTKVWEFLFWAFRGKWWRAHTFRCSLPEKEAYCSLVNVSADMNIVVKVKVTIPPETPTVLSTKLPTKWVSYTHLIQGIRLHETRGCLRYFFYFTLITKESLDIIGLFYSIADLDRPFRFQEVKVLRISRHSARGGYTVVSPTHPRLLPPTRYPWQS
jgi:hypothetical protein